jgi:hypothetical protein
MVHMSPAKAATETVMNPSLKNNAKLDRSLQLGQLGISVMWVVTGLQH